NNQPASAQSLDEFCGAATMFRKWIHPAVKCVETGPWFEGFQHHQTGDRAAGVEVDLAVARNIQGHLVVAAGRRQCFWNYPDARGLRKRIDHRTSHFSNSFHHSRFKLGYWG